MTEAGFFQEQLNVLQRNQAAHDVEIKTQTKDIGEIRITLDDISDVMHQQVTKQDFQEMLESNLNSWAIGALRHGMWVILTAAAVGISGWLLNHWDN